MLSRIDEANFALQPNGHFRFVLLDENPHSDRFQHDSELRWTVSAPLDKKNCLATRAYGSSADDAICILN